MSSDDFVLVLHIPVLPAVVANDLTQRFAAGGIGIHRKSVCVSEAGLAFYFLIEGEVARYPAEGVLQKLFCWIFRAKSVELRSVYVYGPQSLN